MRFFISSYARSVKDGFFKARSLRSLSMVDLAHLTFIARQPNGDTGTNQTDFLPGFSRIQEDSFSGPQISVVGCIIYEKIYELIFIFIDSQKLLIKKIDRSRYLLSLIEKCRLFYGGKKTFQASKGFLLPGF
ncbi:hypothetical protein [Dethiosulfatarculus sandiegensis]|uniref:hypothetical protein n=1 Tax=Dethiosulfatarculus sandiegensis TaxID=1429043 RepID=UPI0018D09F53|nr:hypothetical protein [Dethiosulfatarculus sandiegensis]